MATRREVMGAAALLSILPLIGAIPPAIAGSPASEKLRPYKTIYDCRYAAAQAFGEEAARLGGLTEGFDGDITDLWYRDLHQRWLAYPAAVAGLTTHRALICLEGFARDHRLRVIYQGEHRMRGDGSVEHVNKGPNRILRAADQIPACSVPWSRQLARVMNEFHADTAQMTSSTFTTGSNGSAAADAGTLFSWIIAGTSRA